MGSLVGLSAQELLAPIVQREDPLAPFLPFRIAAAGLEALILDGSEIGDLLPWLGCAGSPMTSIAAASQKPSRHALGRPIPACFVHQAVDGLFFSPSLLDRDIREVGCAIASAAMNEGDAKAMHPKDPVQSVGAWLERPEKCQ